MGVLLIGGGQNTIKKIYQSKYTDKLVTASQYIAEICCERLAKREGKKLKEKFWNDKSWLVFFKRQKTLADNLLKTYSEGAVIQGLTKTGWAYSINTQALLKVIEAISQTEKMIEIPQEEPVKVTQRKEVKKKNLFDLI